LINGLFCKKIDMKIVRLCCHLLALTLLYACGSSGIEVKLIPVRAGQGSGTDGNFEFINKEGKIVINPQFSDAGIFRDGLALVKTTGDSPKYGFINTDGKFVINSIYNSATSFSEGLAWVVKENGAPEAITTAGKTAFMLKQADEVRIFREGRAAYSIVDTSGSKWGFVDDEGATIINPQFSNCGSFSEGLCAVRNSEGKWGYVDKKGTLKISHQFQSAAEFVNGMAVVESGDKYGAIDKDGKFAINPQFKNMVSDGKIFRVYQDEKWGWCDDNGKFLINAQFEEAMNFNNSNLAPVRSGKEFGYVDREGKYVINPQFKRVLPFVNGIAAIQNGNEEIGFIDEQGKFVINPQFNRISEDYAEYAVGKTTSFYSVETDLFDISVITTRVNLESPEGLSARSTMSDAAIKFGKSYSDFSLYTSEHQMLSYSNLNRNISMDFFVMGDPSKDEVVSSGYYPYTQKVFNADASITGFAYRFHLSAKGYGKGKSVLEAIDKLVAGAGYVKDVASSSLTDYSGNSLFNKGNKQIITRWEDENIILYINLQPVEAATAPAADSTAASW
jgi:hypothetical protein